MAYCRTSTRASLALACALAGLATPTPALARPLPIQDEIQSAPPEQITAARKIFLAVAKNLEDIVELHADYTQLQESLLLAKPLESKGRFHLRLEPGCMVLDIGEPSPLHIRSDERTHRIHYPLKQRAEVFLFERNRLTAALIACFRADLAQVEELFTIRSYAETEVPREEGEPQRLATIVLLPHEEELPSSMRSLTVTFDLFRHVPVAVAQVNREGEVVHFQLAAVELRKEVSEDAPEVFDRALPEGTRVVEIKSPAK